MRRNFLVPVPSFQSFDALNAHLEERCLERMDATATDDAAVAELYVVPSPRKPTFLQQERWKAVQQAKLKGMSIRRMARELGIHRDTVRRYIDAESPPTRRSPIASTSAPSDTIADQPSDISAEQSDGHLC